MAASSAKNWLEERSTHSSSGTPTQLSEPPASSPISCGRTEAIAFRILRCCFCRKCESFHVFAWHGSPVIESRRECDFFMPLGRRICTVCGSFSAEISHHRPEKTLPTGT